MVLVWRDNNSICVRIEGELLALCLTAILLSLFARLERIISIIVVKQVAFVTLAEILFDEFKAQLPAILANGLQFTLTE